MRRPCSPRTIVLGGEKVREISAYETVCILGIEGTKVRIKTGYSPVGMTEEEGVLYDPSSDTYTDIIPASGLLSYTGGKDYLLAPSCVLLLY